MAAALINICVDPRLNHEALRQQLRGRFDGQDLALNRIFVVADVGGNVGTAARNTLAMLRTIRERLVAVALLHHDDCVAAGAGMRQALDVSARMLEAEVKMAGFATPVLRGSIVTATSTILWEDRPPKSLEQFTFRMPSMYGR